jgi:Tol biopolymer transport system component
MRPFDPFLLLIAFFPCCLMAEAQTIKQESQPQQITAGLFGPGIISTGMFERDGALSPEGQTFYFTLRYEQGMAGIAYSRKVEGEWTEPRIASFSGEYYDIEPVFHPDGERLFFVSNRPVHDADTTRDFNIWYVRATADGWSEPESLGSPVNGEGNEFYPSFTRDGSIYFTAEREHTLGGEDLYVCEYDGSRYLPPRNLGDSINTGKGEYNSFIAPDGSYIIYTSDGMGPGYGSGDLYIAFRDETGGWRKAVNMGKAVNSSSFEFCPSLSPDGQWLFFTSQRKAPEIEQKPMNYSLLKNFQDKPQNGNGDIYIIDISIIDQIRDKLF